MRRSTACLLVLAGLAAAVPAASADPVAEFYKDKQIRFVVAGAPGGGYDLYLRTLAQFMPAHIPGGPTAVTITMPGAGGAKGTNWAYNAAPRDGTVMVMPFFNLPLFQIIRPEGIRFDVRKMGWVGNMAELNSVIAIFHTHAVKTIEDAKKQEVIVGASGKGTETYFYPQLANAVLGTKFKIVLGYEGTANMTAAMERGEINGRGGSWQIWPVMRPDWVREGKLRVLVQAGLRRDPDLPNVPLIVELAPEVEKPVARLLSSAVVTARMVGTPPDVPADRLDALRRAFDATMKDPAFLAEAKKRTMDLRIMTGEDVAALFDELFRTPPDVVERAKTALGY